jgi:hypothetical protein
MRLHRGRQRTELRPLPAPAPRNPDSEKDLVPLNEWHREWKTVGPTGMRSSGSPRYWGDCNMTADTVDLSLSDGL